MTKEGEPSPDRPVDLFCLGGKKQQERQIAQVDQAAAKLRDDLAADIREAGRRQR